MAVTKNISWGDGSTDNIVLEAASWTGTQTVTLTTPENFGIYRAVNIVFRAASNSSVSATLKCTQAAATLDVTIPSAPESNVIVWQANDTSEKAVQLSTNVSNISSLVISLTGTNKSSFTVSDATALTGGITTFTVKPNGTNLNGSSTLTASIQITLGRLETRTINISQYADALVSEEIQEVVFGGDANEYSTPAPLDDSIYYTNKGVSTPLNQLDFISAQNFTITHTLQKIWLYVKRTYLSGRFEYVYKLPESTDILHMQTAILPWDETWSESVCHFEYNGDIPTSNLDSIGVPVRYGSYNPSLSNVNNNQAVVKCNIGVTSFGATFYDNSGKNQCMVLVAVSVTRTVDGVSKTYFSAWNEATVKPESEDAETGDFTPGTYLESNIITSISNGTGASLVVTPASGTNIPGIANEVSMTAYARNMNCVFTSGTTALLNVPIALYKLRGTPTGMSFVNRVSSYRSGIPSTTASKAQSSAIVEIEANPDKTDERTLDFEFYYPNFIANGAKVAVGSYSLIQSVGVPSYGYNLYLVNGTTKTMFSGRFTLGVEYWHQGVLTGSALYPVTSLPKSSLTAGSTLGLGTISVPIQSGNNSIHLVFTKSTSVSNITFNVQFTDGGTNTSQTLTLNSTTTSAYISRSSSNFIKEDATIDIQVTSFS